MVNVFKQVICRSYLSYVFTCRISSNFSLYIFFSVSFLIFNLFRPHSDPINSLTLENRVEKHREKHFGRNNTKLASGKPTHTKPAQRQHPDQNRHLLTSHRNIIDRSSSWRGTNWGSVLNNFNNNLDWEASLYKWLERGVIVDALDQASSWAPITVVSTEAGTTNAPRPLPSPATLLLLSMDVVDKAWFVVSFVTTWWCHSASNIANKRLALLMVELISSEG